MSDYRPHGAAGPTPGSPSASPSGKAKDVAKEVSVRARNAEVRAQLDTSEFGLLDLRLAQQQGEAAVLVQQQQLLEDQIEQLTLQRHQAERLGLGGVAKAISPAESSMRLAAAEVLNRQQAQQQQAEAQAALVAEASRWRRQVMAAQEAEGWCAPQTLHLHCIETPSG